MIAGGTDLALDLLAPEWHKGGVRPPHTGGRVVAARTGVIDLAADGALRLGAAVTHARLADSPLLRRHAPVLAAAAAAVGSPQVREVGTIGGNVVNALPAADTAIALMALDATAEVASAGGTPPRPLEELYVGVGRSAVDAAARSWSPSAARSPRGAPSAPGRRKALALPVLNVGVALDYDDDLRCSRARIAIGPVAVIPWRARLAEGLLEGAVLPPPRSSRPPTWPAKRRPAAPACAAASSTASR